MEYSTIYLTDNLDDVIKKEITQLLAAFNTKHAGKSNHRVLAIPVEDKNKKIIWWALWENILSMAFH